jgi:plasmid replication initiation protein
MSYISNALSSNPSDFENTRKRRIIENMAEMKYRGTLSKSKLAHHIENNLSSPLKQTSDYSDFSVRFRKSGKESKSVTEFVRSIIAPISTPEIEDLKSRPEQTMNETDLERLATILREELKRANKFLDRLVEKRLIQRQ